MSHRWRTCFVAALVSAACGDTPTTTEVGPQWSKSASGNGGAMCHVIGDTSSNDRARALGSEQNPFGSLAAVEAEVRCRNIDVLYSATPLDGGITLREGQKLRGRAGPGGVRPVLTNTTSANDGRGVVLSNKTTVSGLHVTGTLASGIYGLDVDGVEIVDNELTGFNTSLAIHPHFWGLANIRVYFGGIHLEGRRAGKRLDATVARNDLHDALTVGISILALGDSDQRVRLDGNTLRRLAQHRRNPDRDPADRPDPRFTGSGMVAPAINVFASDRSQLDVRLDATVIEDHGPVFLGLPSLDPTIDFDGMWILASRGAALRAVVDGLRFTDTGTPARGTFGTNAIQAGLDAGSAGASIDLEIRNSVIRDPFGSPLALVGYYEMQNTSQRYVVKHNTFDGPRVPFQPTVTLQHGSGTIPHTPTFGSTVELDFSGNVVRRRPGGVADGFNFVNYGGSISDLALSFEDNDFIGAGSRGAALHFADQSATLAASIDVGGGASGSAGRNSMTGFDVDLKTVGYAVQARSNWWGSPGGPTNLVALASGTIDYLPFLTAPPAR